MNPVDEEIQRDLKKIYDYFYISDKEERKQRISDGVNDVLYKIDIAYPKDSPQKTTAKYIANLMKMRGTQFNFAHEAIPEYVSWVDLSSPLYSRNFIQEVHVGGMYQEGNAIFYYPSLVNDDLITIILIYSK